MKKNGKIVPINFIDDMEHYVLVPSYVKGKPTRRIKELSKVKGNCYFVKGVARGLYDFIYRAVVKLDIKDKKLIFSRGTVRTKKRSVTNRVDIYELDWDVGISILIPRKLNYKDTMALLINNKKMDLRIMEIIVLAGLLHIAHPEKSYTWQTEMAATIIGLGWKEYDAGKPAKVFKAE